MKAEAKMKKIIDVEVRTKRIEPEGCKMDMLCVGVFKGEKRLDKTCSLLNKMLDGRIEKLLKLGEVAQLFRNGR